MIRHNRLQERLATRADVLQISIKRLISFALEEVYQFHSKNIFLFWTMKA